MDLEQDKDGFERKGSLRWDMGNQFLTTLFVNKVYIIFISKMEIISTTFKRIKSGGQAAVPRIGSVTKKGISVVGNLGSKIIKGKQKPKNAQSIMSLLTEGDIKYGDENLLEDEEAIFECLLNTNPKEVCKALTTILSILLYCSNSSHSSRSAPNLDSALTEEEDLRTRIMKKFYPAVVN